MTVSDLIERLRTPEREGAEGELLTIGNSAAASLVFASYCFDISNETAARDTALSVLRQIARPGTERFVAAMAGGHLRAKHGMSDALGMLVWTNEAESDASLVDMIARFLRCGGKCGEEAAEVLGASGSPLAVPRLLEALAEYPPQQWPSMDVVDLRLCRQIARALCGFNDSCAAAPLAEFLYHPDVSLSRYAASALAGIGEPAREMIKTIVSGLVVPVRNAPKPLRELELLRVLGDAECVTPIAIRACDPDPEVRAYALAALGSLPLTQEQLVAMAELLLQGMKDPEPDVRRAAIDHLTEAHIVAAVAHMSALREVSADEARRSLLAPLVQALNDENESVRSSALTSLQDLEDAIKERMPPAEAADAAVPDPALEGPRDANEALVSLWTDMDGDWDFTKAAAITVVAIRAASADGADINTRDQVGTTALMAFAWVGHSEAVRLLLSMEADVNATDVSGRTALMKATFGGNAKVTRLLLEAGADWTVMNRDGKTAVHEAENPHESVPEENKAATVAILRAAINAKLVSLWTDPNGKLDAEKALTMTVDAVKAALQAGASVEAQDQQGTTALAVAAQAGRSNIVSFLVSAGASVNTWAEGAWPAVILAAQGQHLDVLRILLDSGADPNVIENGYTALKFAASKGNIEIMRLLLEEGADPDAGRFGWTALSYAATHDRVEAMRLLLGAGADPDAPQEGSGKTLLLEIAGYGGPEVFNFLLKAGADRDAVDNDGRTALMLAATNGNAAGVRRLVEAGVNVGSIDADGHTALWHAENPQPHISEESGMETVAVLRAALNAALLALWTGDSTSPDRKFPTRRMIQAALDGGAEVNGVDEAGWTALLRACDYSHILGVGLLLENGANVQATTPTGLSGMMLAARNGNVEVVRLLLKAGVNVNASNQIGETPLLFAAKNGHTPVVRLLVKHQADVNMADDDKWTPLFFACVGGHRETAGVLLENHANLNPPYEGEEYDEDGNYNYNALVSACQDGRANVVELLLNAGANVQAADPETPLEIAASSNNVEIARLLLEAGADVNHDHGQHPVLSEAAEHGYAELVILFLTFDARLEARDDNRTTALMEACHNGHLEIIRLLLKAGANVDASNRDGCRALRFAASNSSPDAVKLLLEFGADVNAVTKSGSTALMTAAYYGNVDDVQTLLDAGATVAASSDSGNTALMSASQGGSANVVSLLIASEAEVDTVNCVGCTALMVACDHGHADVVRLLLAAEADVEAVDQDAWTPLMFAAKKGNKEVIRLLLEAKAPADPQATDGWRPLAIAACEGHTDAVRLLLAADADVNARSRHGKTALLWAATGNRNQIEFAQALRGWAGKPTEQVTGGHLEVVQTLLASKAEADATDKNGQTALMIAAREGHLEVMRLLLGAGADKNAADHQGATALMRACEDWFPEIAGFLLSQGADKTIMDKNGRNAHQYTEISYQRWYQQWMHDQHDNLSMKDEAENEAERSRLEAVRLLLEPETSDTNAANGKL